MRKLLALPTLIIVLSGLLAACGGDDSSNGTDDTSGAEETSTTASEPVAAADVSLPENAPSFCTTLLDLAKTLERTDAEASQQIVDQLTSAAEAAPEQVKPSLTTFSEAVTPLVLATDAAAQSAAQTKFETDETLKAWAFIGTWTVQQCGPDLASAVDFVPGGLDAARMAEIDLDEFDAAWEADLKDILKPEAVELPTPPPGETAAAPTTCPAADGSSPRTTQFAEAPPTCIDPAKTYTASFSTSKGDFEVELDTEAAPNTVNNFVVLARYHFYDGIPFHRIAPDFVIQAGDPLGEPWGTHGPGYTIAEEPPDGKYAKYDIAMAKTSSPNSTGSQFFVVTGDTGPLDGNPTYSLFGHVTSGQDVVDAIGAIPGLGGGDQPSEAVVINSVTISES